LCHYLSSTRVFLVIANVAAKRSKVFKQAAANAGSKSASSLYHWTVNVYAVKGRKSCLFQKLRVESAAFVNTWS
jgi:hypothetical protein